MGKGLTANDTVFIMHRRTLNRRIFLVSRTCSRERRGAVSGALGVATSPSTRNIRSLSTVKSTSYIHGLQRWSDPPDAHQRLRRRHDAVSFFHLFTVRYLAIFFFLRWILCLLLRPFPFFHPRAILRLAPLLWLFVFVLNPCACHTRHFVPIFLSFPSSHALLSLQRVLSAPLLPGASSPG